MAVSAFAGARPSITKHPVDVGLRTEAAILAELVKRGYNVLVPFNVNQRYDLVVDIGGRFVRCQCKTARRRAGTISFKTRSIVTSKTRNVARGYADEADVFLVYCPATSGVYVVPVHDAPGHQMSLRLDPCRNGQCQGVNWAADYLLPE